MNYAVQAGQQLVFSVDGGAWEKITFRRADLGRGAGGPTARELAAAIKKAGTELSAAVEDGVLVLETRDVGGHTSLEIDARSSSAAAALGLGPGQAHAAGSGLQAARLVGTAAEPFRLAKGAELRLEVDGAARVVRFDKVDARRGATAEAVADVVNAKRPAVARVTREGRVMLTSPTVGAGSALRVIPGAPPAADAAAVLGFLGPNALSEPYRSAPARITCGRGGAVLSVENLTAGPVELHLRGGAAVLAGRGALAISADDAGDEALQNLIQKGIVRLAAAKP